jgi:hypothetical protein
MSFYGERVGVGDVGVVAVPVGDAGELVVPVGEVDVVVVVSVG